MPSDALVTVHANQAAGTEFRDAIAEATTEVFVYDIWPAAVEGSPVAKGKLHGGSYAGGGTNRRSITVEVVPFGGAPQVAGGQGEDKKGVPFDHGGGVATQDPEGVTAAIFTQSGYGGFLEVGTRYMAARAYIYPAVERFIQKIGERARAIIAGRGQ